MTGNDPRDKRTWSGSTYYIARALQQHVGEVDLLGPLKVPFWMDRLFRAIAKLVRVTFGTEYFAQFSIPLSLYYAGALRRRMRGNHYDLICAPASNVELAYVKTHLPVVLIADTTFQLITHYYAKDFKKMSRLSRWEGNLLEKRSLKRSRLSVFSSEWAADSAIKDYKVDARKVAIIPPGANMDHRPEADIIHRKFANPRLTVLFLASEWSGKGGDLALQTLTLLREVHGEDARLIVCGCEPPPGIEHPDMEVIPLQAKNSELLSTVHFLIQPTRADASLIIACEANAYGVPAITTETGGIPDVVQDGVNGYCLPYHADGRLYALLISELFKDQERYEQLVQTSRMRFEEKLNWDSWAESFQEAASAAMPELSR
ncbi:glycosyltransferase family 4 protein [Dinghuibacter silviterrae]|uniref:Glycosyltransferase involved in cell wall biosynthesis n=1 Tax=Dinghuibacter silviterrae TaxID=1539049 RepID=A0A4R8DWL9_9BACT|nr:glycosyltransferase family 4 protein [Dinghuibacter silviterrae]TDX01915.1 glycosyltransferase involved in cell wall biosynthesis [Dinghuibacter silviterrae]